MPFETLTCNNVLVIRWRAVDLDDEQPFRRAVDELLKKGSDKATVINIVDGHAPRPPANARSTINKVTVDTAPHLNSVHLVLLGSGIGIAAQRAFAAGVLLVTGKTNLKLHNSLAAALDTAAVGEPTRAYLSTECSRRGFLDVAA